MRLLDSSIEWIYVPLRFPFCIIMGLTLSKKLQLFAELSYTCKHTEI
jgi:hypothetical protein